MKQDDFCCGHSLHLQHSTFQIERNRFKHSEICDFKNWLSFFVFFFLFFFLFSHTYKNCYKTRTPYPIALKFGTQKGDIKAHLCTNFGWNTINRQRVMSDYSRKITPICDWIYENRSYRPRQEVRFFYKNTKLNECTIKFHCHSRPE